MKSKVIIVTGAGRGIGRAIACALAERKHRVVLAGRTASTLEDACAQIAASADDVLPVICDVTSSSDVKSLLETAVAQFGRVDALVNNAGAGRFQPLEDTSDEIWDETIDTNLKGAFLCCREATPHMERAGGGLIVNIASIAAIRAFPNNAAYAASKAGLLGLSNVLREELRPKGIRVAAVLPGATDSPFWDSVEGDWDRSKMLRAEDVARAVAAVIDQPVHMTTEEIVLMPAGGAL